MKGALPDNAKIAKEAKECMQECVSEFISFITSEGTSCYCQRTSTIMLDWRADRHLVASEKCQQEKRKTVNGEDILFAMTSLGFENYAEALKIYLARYREVSVRPCCQMNHRADQGSQTLVARGEHQRPITGGTTLNSSGGAQETSPFEDNNHGGAVLTNTMEAAEGSYDYAYGVGQGATGEP